MSRMVWLTWPLAAYLLVMVCGFYLDIGNVRRHHLEAAAFVLVAVVLVIAVRAERSDRSPSAESAAPPAYVAGAAASFCVALALYAPVIRSGFFADDFVLLEAARAGRWTVWTEFFRPAIFFVWRSVEAVAGRIDIWLHVLNVGLHALNAVMVSKLAFLVTRAPSTAILAGALFVGFPASVEAVAWPSGLQDVLMTTFVLAHLVVLTHARSTAGAAVLCVALLLIGCLVKETAVAGAALAVLTCLVLRLPASKWMVVAASSAAVGGMLSIRFAWLPYPSRVVPQPVRYAVKELIVRPFATLLVPLRDAEAAAMPWIPIVLTAIVVAALMASSRDWDRDDVRFRAAVLGVVFVLVSVAPVGALFFISGDLLGSRYLYLGSAGWAMALAAMLDRPRRSITLGVATAVMLVGFTMGTRAHVYLWASAATARERIIGAAQHPALSECREAVVHGLPATDNGVPLFLNGFPQAMRERLPEVRFHVDRSAPHADCHLQWTGSQFDRR